MKPEISNSYSLGLTGNLFKNLTFKADAYQIDIRDRIVLSGLYSRERTDNGAIMRSGAVNQVLDKIDPVGYINGVQFFSNAVSTQTRGLDLALSDRFNLRRAGQDLTLTAALSVNQTSVGDIYAPDEISNNATLTDNLFNRQERSRIESAIPNNKVILSAQYGEKHGEWL